MGELKNISELARFYGVTQQAMGLRLGVAGLKEVKKVGLKKYFDCDTVREAFEARKKKVANVREIVIDETEAGARLKQVQYELKRLELMQKEGKLADIAFVIKAVEKLREGIKSYLLSIPTRFSIQCEMRTSGEIKKILENGIDGVLNEISNFDPTRDIELLSETDTNNEGVSATGEAIPNEMVGEEYQDVNGVRGGSGAVRPDESTLPDRGDGGDIRPGD
jgi:phage terminase Nu1 subunit (DNA packaging protein)